MLQKYSKSLFPELTLERGARKICAVLIENSLFRACLTRSFNFYTPEHRVECTQSACRVRVREGQKKKKYERKKPTVRVIRTDAN